MGYLLAGQAKSASNTEGSGEHQRRHCLAPKLIQEGPRLRQRSAVFPRPGPRSESKQAASETITGDEGKMRVAGRHAALRGRNHRRALPSPSLSPLPQKVLASNRIPFSWPAKLVLPTSALAMCIIIGGNFLHMR